jgi:hypothetical protein
VLCEGRGFWCLEGDWQRAGVGGEGGAVLVGERNGLFGVAGDGEDAIVVGLVATVTKVDHVLDRRGSINPVFEDVVRLGFADALTLGNPARPVAKRKVSILSPIGMVRSGEKAGW